MIVINTTKISCGDYTAEIILSRGANCISLKNKKYNADILHTADYTDNPFICGMPVLFPVNRISGGEFWFEGRQYCFPVNDPHSGCHIHGFLHKAEFALTACGKSFVRGRYDSDALYSFFPHRFAVETEYSLSEQGLSQEICIYNLSDSNMPIFLGFHTTFNIPFIQGASAENVTVLAEIEDEIERNDIFLPSGKLLPWDEISEQLSNGEFVSFGNKLSRHYKAEKDGRLELLDTENRVKIVYNTDKKFTWRLLYNGEAKNYICLEPQSCMVNCPNAGFDRNYSGFDYIKPNAYKKYVSQIYLEELSQL